MGSQIFPTPTTVSGTISSSYLPVNASSVLTDGQLVPALIASGTVVISGTANNINGPYGLAFDAQQNLWITSYFNNTLVRVASGTTTATVQISGATNNISGPPYGLAFDAQQNLWIANYNNTLVRVASSSIFPTLGSGTYTTTITGTGGLAYLYTNNTGTVTLSGSSINQSYTVNSGVITTTAAFSGTTNATVTSTAYQPVVPTSLSLIASGGYPSSPALYVTSGNNTIIASRNDTGLISYSTNNGASWNSASMPQGSYTYSNAVGFYNGYFYAFTTGNGAYSTNGYTWSNFSAPGAQNGLFSFAVGNGVMLIGGNGAFSYSQAITTSPVNTGWTQNSSPGIYTTYYSQIAFGNGVFACVQQSSNPTVVYSYNGINWFTSSYSAPNTNGSYIALCFANGIFVAICGNDTSSTPAYGAWTPNPVTTAWTPLTMPARLSWNTLCFANGVFFCIASYTASAYSTNGYTWTSIANPNTLQSWYGVTYMNGYFVGTSSSYISANPGPSMSFVSNQQPFANLSYGIYNGPTTLH